MNSVKKKAIKRRRILPILGTGLLLSLLPFKLRASEKKEDPEYQTLLKPDGSVVQVKSASLNKSRMIHKKINNKELLGWLKKDSPDS